MLQGVLPVLATPFAASGEVDHESLRRLVRYVDRGGCRGVVFPGVASEFDFLTAEERTRALEVVAETVAGRLPIVVGASAPTAAEAGALAREGAARGAAAAMVMAPAAVGSATEPLVQFFRAVVAEAGIPIVLQNAPPPVGAGLPVETTLEVAARVPEIRFVKEETTALRPADHAADRRSARDPRGRDRRRRRTLHRGRAQSRGGRDDAGGRADGGACGARCGRTGPAMGDGARRSSTAPCPS